MPEQGSLITMGFANALIAYWAGVSYAFSEAEMSPWEREAAGLTDHTDGYKEPSDKKVEASWDWGEEPTDPENTEESATAKFS